MVDRALDTSAMMDACAAFQGTHDFTAFRAAGYVPLGGAVQAGRSVFGGILVAGYNPYIHG